MFLLICGLLSFIIGTINSMYQFKIKRFLAYSAIANVGFILISLSFYSLESLYISLFYVFSYIINVFLIFFILISVRKSDLTEFKYLYEFSNINYSNNILLLVISFIFFSFIGIPPLLGFFGKFFVY
jgi:NADH:ubiquinone oxidoreductase subunit 2 (subunit N)